MIAGFGGGSPTDYTGAPAFMDKGQQWQEPTTDWRTGQKIPGRVTGGAQPQVNYGTYGAAPPGMDPNEFLIGRTGQTSGGQQVDAFQPALDAYKSTLGGAQQTASDLAGMRYNIQNPGQYGGGQVKQQMAGGFNPGQLYSNSLDPLVQQQLSRGQQEAGLQARSMAQQVAQSAGGNRALGAALGQRGMQQAMLAGNQMRTDALGAQSQRDIAQRQAAEGAFGLNLQGMGQNNAARMAQEQARQSAYGLNQQTAGMMNQANAQQIGAYTGAAAPQSNLVGMLGSQLPAFGNQWTNNTATSLGRREQPSGGK